MLRLQWRRMRSKYPWLQTFKSWRCVALLIFVVLLIWYVAAVLNQRKVRPEIKHIKETRVGDLEFDFRTGLYVLRNHDGVYLRGLISEGLQLPIECGKYNASQFLCAVWFRHVQLEVNRIEEEYAVCHRLTWTSTGVVNDFSPQDCISLGDAQWYGGPQLYDQQWPVSKSSVNYQSFVSKDLLQHQGEGNVIGNTLEWFWINSRGVSVMVDPSVPLHFSLNVSANNLLCLNAKYDSQDGIKTAQSRPTLKYTLCKSKNLRRIHKYVMSKIVDIPQTPVDEKLFMNPVWSTFPYFMKTDMNQISLMQFVQNITNKGFPKNILEIHDSTSSLLSTLPLGKEKFLNSHQMLMTFRENEFQVSLGISPFVGLDSVDFKDESTKGFWISETGKDTPALVKWNEQKVAVLNLYNPNAFDWFKTRLNQLKEWFGVIAFTFLGGESNYLPSFLQYMKHRPGVFSQKLIELAASVSGNHYLTCGHHTQKVAAFIQLNSGDSRWDHKGGLQGIIPTVLNLGIVGYPFLIPGVIGGLGHVTRASNGSVIKVEKPERELYIRWLQLASYMPGLTISYPPWMYDEEVTELAKQLLEVREKEVVPVILKAAREAELTGTPIIRPLWWNDQEDRNTLKVDDQFLVGDTLLVAPVVMKGARSRDIYLPSGLWKDNLRNEEVGGKTVIKNYKVDLMEVATFTKLKSPIV